MEVTLLYWMYAWGVCGYAKRLRPVLECVMVYLYSPQSVSVLGVSQSNVSTIQHIVLVMGSSNGKPVLRDEDVETIMKTSGMSEHQIRQDFEVFIKEYPSGLLKQFVNICKLFKNQVYERLLYGI